MRWTISTVGAARLAGDQAHRVGLGRGPRRPRRCGRRCPRPRTSRDGRCAAAAARTCGPPRRPRVRWACGRPTAAGRRVDDHPERAGVDHPAAVRLLDRHPRRRSAAGAATVNGGDPGERHRRGVRDQLLLAVADERCERALDDAFQHAGDPGVVGLGLAVHPGDRAAGQDVVELLQQDGLPDPAELLGRVLQPGPHRRPSSPTAPPPAAGARCAGCPAWCAAARCRCRGGSPGTSRPTRCPGSAARPRPRRRTRAAVPIRTRRRALEVGGAVGLRHHLAGRPAAAVAVAEGHQRDRPVALLGVLALGLGELERREPGVVGVDRRQVGEDPGAVDALPPEGVVGQHVGLVPGHLLGQEAAATPAAVAICGSAPE